MKIASWNVNGLRACWDKGLRDYILDSGADIIGLQETKTSEPLPELETLGFGVDWNSGERPGYSGTVCLFRKKPIAVTHGLDVPKLDTEGRLITLEYPRFFFVNAYVPNSQGGLERWYYRLEWDEAFYVFLERLLQSKPVIVCGDFNVASEYIDIYPENTRNVEKQPGFITEERDAFHALLDSGFADSFRLLHPEETGAYSWWSNRLKKRNENRGWRIDYALVSEELTPLIIDASIRADIMGSDHAPIEVVIGL
jgi:exodeoxyribonuclease-3